MQRENPINHRWRSAGQKGWLPTTPSAEHHLSYFASLCSPHHLCLVPKISQLLLFKAIDVYCYTHRTLIPVQPSTLSLTILPRIHIQTYISLRTNPPTYLSASSTRPVSDRLLCLIFD